MSYKDPQPHKGKQVLTGLSSKEKRLLGSLKILNLSYCYQLRSLRGFCELPALENLFLTNCTCLIEVCESIEQCGELVLVDFSYCSEFRKFLRTIYKLKKVKTLKLNGCNLSELTIDEDSRNVSNCKSIAIISRTSSSGIVEAISRDLKSLTIYFPKSLARLSLKDNNLSCESFPLDFSGLSMLKELNLDGNPIVSMPNCVRSLPRLETLSMDNCNMLLTIQHPPPTLRNLSYLTYKSSSTDRHFMQKVEFEPEMSPLKLSSSYRKVAYSSIEIEGIIKIQPMAGVEKTALRSLGWSNLDFLKRRRVGTYDLYGQPHGSQTQMYYEFGIFSTIYGGKVMPSWIRRRRKGPSISFTIPSSPRKLKGLNFCYVQKLRPQFRKYEFQDGLFRNPYADHSFQLPIIKISNKTKNRTWIYNHFIERVTVGGECLTFLSHWMFGMDEMEGGDLVEITLYPGYDINKCGVRAVYEDVDDHEKEEDALEYYKSWNHIIGGDLSAFQTTSGEYILDTKEFWRTDDNSLSVG